MEQFLSPNHEKWIPKSEDTANFLLETSANMLTLEKSVSQPMREDGKALPLDQSQASIQFCREFLYWRERERGRERELER